MAVNKRKEGRREGFGTKNPGFRVIPDFESRFHYELIDFDSHVTTWNLDFNTCEGTIAHRVSSVSGRTTRNRTRKVPGLKQFLHRARSPTTPSPC